MNTPTNKPATRGQPIQNIVYIDDSYGVSADVRARLSTQLSAYYHTGDVRWDRDNPQYECHSPNTQWAMGQLHKDPHLRAATIVHFIASSHGTFSRAAYLRYKYAVRHKKTVHVQLGRKVWIDAAIIECQIPGYYRGDQPIGTTYIARNNRTGDVSAYREEYSGDDWRESREMWEGARHG